MPPTFRRFDRKRDREAVHRIWLECGWLESEDEPIESP